MGNIVLLDELTINQIAAGEVIERPASVIKEMVENSIDAGATNINIEIKNGGISYIRITDNGKGIAKDDMEMAFERHATSKIRSADDLNTVTSMGFRGEALASIAAIAKVEMASRMKEQEVGNRIVVEAGNILEMEETGAPLGTTITVQNLFFNTPVRYKFLKKDYTESGYIEDTITRLALVNPSISFKLINTGKTILQTSGNGKIQDVIYAVYGRDIANAIVEVDYQYDAIKVTGVVGKPEVARSNRSNQLFFVNKRFVKDKTLAGAAENSFKGLLPVGKYGFLVLNIEIDPSKVDVNVHPAKLEVRFQEESKVFKAVYHAIKDNLLGTELIESVEKQREEPLLKMNEQDKKPTITDLFKKIANNTNEVDEVRDNMIAQMYQQKEKEKEQLQKKEEKPKNLKEVSPTTIGGFAELLQLQRKLKEEVEKNPNLHTNIDRIIQDTNKIQERNKSEIPERMPTMVQEPETQKINSFDLIMNKMPTIEQIQPEEKIENRLEEILLPKEENLEEKEELVKVEEETRRNVLLPEELLKEEIVAKHPKQLEKEEVNETLDKIEKQEQTDYTRVFSAEELSEMLQKLEKMENVPENPEFGKMYQQIFGKLPASMQETMKEEEAKINASELIKEENISVFEECQEYNKPEYKFVGIAFSTYIIIEIDKEMYLIDQHAAHERIMYEKIKENYYQEKDKDSQMLLLPDIITLTHKEMDIARDNYEMFEKAGFSLEEFGDNTIKLSGVPNICLDLDTKELFLETLDEINTVARTAKQEIEEKFIATIACKAAVKANMALTVQEVNKLMDDLLQLPNPFTCPHGRPTAIKMAKTDIEKKFARRK